MQLQRPGGPSGRGCALLVALALLGCPGCVLHLPVRAGAAEDRWALDLRVSMQDLAKYAKTPGATTKTPGDTLAAPRRTGIDTGAVACHSSGGASGLAHEAVTLGGRE